MSRLVEFCKYHKDFVAINGSIMADLCDLIDSEFNAAPFFMGLGMEKMSSLDDPFTDEPVIIIRDGRIRDNNIYYKELVPNDEYLKYNDLLIVKAESRDKPITLRQVINAMIASNHYQSEEVSEDFHCILEDIEKSPRSDIEYIAIFDT